MTMHRSATVIAGAALVALLQGCASTPLEPWHTERLREEFTAAKADDVKTFADYVALEERLFAELDDEVYDRVDTGPAYALARYSKSSAADPQRYRKNWNRSFEFPSDEPRGGVLLLHGMSDSPYSLRALAESLGERGYWVSGLRLPGHGTAPSGLRFVKTADMIAAVRLAMTHLVESVDDRPVHIVGYSNGAALALDYALDAADGLVSPEPASLILISPAIRISGTAALSSVKDSLGAVPGFRGLNWLSIMPEFDPYKYNSFATNASDVVHRLTRDVDRRLAARTDGAAPLPPILAFKSTVDATVTTEAIVDNLLVRLKHDRHELVLFDVNRLAAKEMLLVDDPGPLTNRLLTEDALPFGVTVISNADDQSRAVVARFKAPGSRDISSTTSLGMSWPQDVYSLSHVALPFPIDDPLYGPHPPEDDDTLHFGKIALRGERDLYKLPGNWLVRMRYNPFYDLLETRTLQWIEAAGR
ncbi:MAG: alpha/beta fold hydrolase [Gammaproteobacteria bacterium]|nr:alpha/beta fold hydrolase [Gammaproteobacteria bacterium]